MESQHLLSFDAPAQAITEPAASIARAEQNANAEWLEAARSAVRSVCVSNLWFTTDAVWDAIGDVETHEHRAMGAVMSWAQKEKLCRVTDRQQKSIRKACHSRPVRVWESLEAT